MSSRPTRLRRKDGDELSPDLTHEWLDGVDRRQESFRSASPNVWTMHPRSPYYEKQTDFNDLADYYPPMKPFVKNSQINFKDANALRQLTKALLKRDFGLEIDLPEDRLCPPVPNRLNYVLWIQDLLDTTPQYLSIYDTLETSSIVGLDIGTGSSCIYPLLACTLRPWTMYCTDIDTKSLEFASRNIQLNNLQSRINILSTFPEGPLLPLNLFQIPRLDFCMCNPPFYTDAAELYEHARAKSLEPFSSCTGSPKEMCTPGGEVGFITRLIEESLVIRERVRWYSSMLGKLSSVSTLVQKLKQHEIENYALTEFEQGTTKRWGIAWSFLPYRPREEVSCPTAFALRNFTPKTPRYIIDAPLSASFTIPIIQSFLSSLRTIQYTWENNIGIGAVSGNVWSRSARRKTQDDTAIDEGIKLGFRVSVKDATNEASRVAIEWRIGTDVVLFESFSGKLKGIVQRNSHQ